VRRMCSGEIRADVRALFQSNCKPTCMKRPRYLPGKSLISDEPIDGWRAVRNTCAQDSRAAVGCTLPGVRHDRDSRFGCHRTLLVPASVSTEYYSASVSPSSDPGIVEGSSYDREYSRDEKGPDDRPLRPCPIAQS
jgi:hypothetical protein